MKVLFANPPWWDGTRAGVRCGSRWPFAFDSRSQPDRPHWPEYCPYPFFMGYAATYAMRHVPGATVRLWDSIQNRESYRSFMARLKEYAPDFVVLESASPSWEHDRKLVRAIHATLPGVKIIVTGPIATADGGRIMDEQPVHACVRGEYEKGVVRAIGGEVGLIDFDMLTEAEMNAAPTPYWDQWQAHRYFDYNPIGQKFPHAQVWSSRGCPFKCIFCVWPATMTGNDPDGKQPRAARYYSAEYMRAYLRDLRARFPDFRSIYFDDDTFNLGNKHTLEMCAVMREVGLPWSAMCRADTIKTGVWREMKESGCFGVKLGFESGVQAVVDNIVNKHLNLEQAAATVRHLKELGMTVHGTFTIGLPGETREQMKATIAFADSLPLDSRQISGTAEIEGTPLATMHSSAEGYTRDTDGNRKWQALAKELADQ